MLDPGQRAISEAAQWRNVFGQQQQTQWHHPQTEDCQNAENAPQDEQQAPGKRTHCEDGLRNQRAAD